MIEKTSPVASVGLAEPRTPSDWKQGLPVLAGEQIALREIELSDAKAVMALVSADEVSRFISAPPDSVQGFEMFIADARTNRAAGGGGCYVVVVKGFDTPIGLFQLRAIERPFGIAEWGFALDSRFWGTGIFQEAATLFLTFVFGPMGVHRLEARAAVRNGRGNGALRKLGAVQEGVLRKSFYRNGEFYDQVLYAMVEDDWRAARSVKVRPHIH